MIKALGRTQVGKHAKTYILDVDDFEVARSIHRVVRAMHDGECPNCHLLFASTSMLADRLDHVCPHCGFTITKQESAAAIKMFAPVMKKNLAVFEKWRQQRK